MKLKKTQRIAAITHILTERPNHIFSLGEFVQTFQTAKSTISEDLSLVKEVFESLSLGRIETIAGAQGGVRYRPAVGFSQAESFLQKLSQDLSKESRILPGDFLYMTDLLTHPQTASMLGRIFATMLPQDQAHYIATIETKGIPIALMTAQAMNLPLLVIRKSFRASEGPSMSITYASPSQSAIRSMNLSTKNIVPGSSVILLDDYMRGGATLLGMKTLMSELRLQVCASAVLIESTSCEQKRLPVSFSLLGLDESRQGRWIEPSKSFYGNFPQNRTQ